MQSSTDAGGTVICGEPETEGSEGKYGVGWNVFDGQIEYYVSWYLAAHVCVHIHLHECTYACLHYHVDMCVQVTKNPADERKRRNY